ncbi:MAG: hypothetical protein IPO77_16270 [Acidobacteria bacterium]|nr:hypothetical protein [Acidobacteriota bacterium]
MLPESQCAHLNADFILTDRLDHPFLIERNDPHPVSCLKIHCRLELIDLRLANFSRIKRPGETARLGRLLMHPSGSRPGRALELNGSPLDILFDPTRIRCIFY